MFPSFLRYKNHKVEEPSPQSAGRLLALEGHRQYKQRVRDKCDEMRRNMGLPPVDWNAW